MIWQNSVPDGHGKGRKLWVNVLDDFFSDYLEEFKKIGLESNSESIDLHIKYFLNLDLEESNPSFNFKINLSESDFDSTLVEIKANLKDVEKLVYNSKEFNEHGDGPSIWTLVRFRFEIQHSV